MSKHGFDQIKRVGDALTMSAARKEFQRLGLPKSLLDRSFSEIDPRDVIPRERFEAVIKDFYRCKMAIEQRSADVPRTQCETETLRGDFTSANTGAASQRFWQATDNAFATIGGVMESAGISSALDAMGRGMKSLLCAIGMDSDNDSGPPTDLRGGPTMA